ncbi:hypothetical protein LR48_Vigan11g153300 [Vigna angularis]|uniref:Pectate lyase superfamily protein domain-containing protein n=1 Tax=Phaseolus angularis TaxID=3914 RepID=A0A0L9VUQ8_PHAAN|nr:probable polygalacturonase At3g15720 [Vigna angularis]KOM58499.1 hypothetical protein LR48_Vigan11g153300 [Vigna angularis]
MFGRSIVGSQITFHNVVNYGARGDGKSDDSHAFLSAWKDTCRTAGTPILVIPKNGVFKVKNINLSGPCKAKSIHIQLQGKIVAPQRNEWAKGLQVDDKSSLILISQVNSLRILGSGQINGFGSSWWNCPSCQRPKVIGFEQCNDLRVSYLSIIDSPRAHVTVDGCNNAVFSHINIHAPGDSPNTDGFDISASKYITIQDSIIGTGDDCIAINGGSSFINATRIACGPGHGISVGSLGRNREHDTVEEVYVRNCSFTNTQNGARIKTWKGGSGFARKITYEKITLRKAFNPIIIDQHYDYDGLKGGAVKVSDVTFRGFEGTSGDEKTIDIDCDSSGCFNIVLEDINIASSEQGKPASCSCSNAHAITKSTTPNCNCLMK